MWTSNSWFGFNNYSLNEAEFHLGGAEHEANHADMAQLHKEMAEKHRRLGGVFNEKAAREHDLAAEAQTIAADHIYSFEQSNKTHSASHEPKIKAAIDKAAEQSKVAFSASHLLDIEESVK